MKFSHYIYKYRFINDKGRWQETLEYYASNAEFIKDFPEVKQFQSIEATKQPIHIEGHYLD